MIKYIHREGLEKKSIISYRGLAGRFEGGQYIPSEPKEKKIRIFPARKILIKRIKRKKIYAKQNEILTGIKIKAKRIVELEDFIKIKKQKRKGRYEFVKSGFVKISEGTFIRADNIFITEQGRKATTGYPDYFNTFLKESIRQRDNYLCQKCGISEEQYYFLYQTKLAIHHIDYEKMNCQKRNLITLCVKCNISVNANRDYWIKFFQRIMQRKKESPELYLDPLLV